MSNIADLKVVRDSNCPENSDVLSGKTELSISPWPQRVYISSIRKNSYLLLCKKSSSCNVPWITVLLKKRNSLRKDVVAQYDSTSYFISFLYLFFMLLSCTLCSKFEDYLLSKCENLVKPIEGLLTNRLRLLSVVTAFFIRHGYVQRTSNNVSKRKLFVPYAALM